MTGLRTYIQDWNQSREAISQKKGKSGKCESPISLNPVKENHGKLPVKQTSREERFPETEKYKTPVRVHQKLQWEVHQKFQWEFRKIQWGNPSPQVEIRDKVRFFRRRL